MVKNFIGYYNGKNIIVAKFILRRGNNNWMKYYD